jgi:phosphate transport system permease protein
LGAVIVLLMMGSLVFVLFHASFDSMKTFGAKFLVTSTWRPNELEVPKKTPDGKTVKDSDGEIVIETLPAQFGALPVIYGTAVSSGLALLFAVPLSLGAALFLIRIAPRYRPRLPNGWQVPVDVWTSFLIEFLAAIPSIAYGLWGLFVLVPFMQKHIEPSLNWVFKHVPGLGFLHSDSLTGRDMLTGSLVLGIMIVPIITAVSRDVLRAVPQAQIEGSLALGATWWQSCKEMFRYSRSGLFGAIMLGLARAAGETMAVTMVIGNVTRINASPLAPAQTMSSLLANEFAEAQPGLHVSALLQVALILLVMSLAFNIVARQLVVGKSGAVRT